MRRSNRILRTALAAAFTLVILGAFVPSITTANAAGAAPTASATPPSGLLDGQFVTVSWTGFPASTPPDDLEAVTISQCKAAPLLPMTDCAIAVSGVSDSTGAGVATLQLHTGTITARDGSHTFTCDHTTACTVAVYLDPTKPISPPKNGFPAVTTPISFGFPPDDCPHGGAGISGSGGEAAQHAMLAWEAAVCQAPTSLDLQYTRTESTDAKQAFIGRPGLPLPNYAVTSIPFTATERATLATQKRTFGYAPLTASGLVFAFHGTDRVTGQPLTHLTLTPAELAHIFNGTRNSMPTSASDQESTDIIDLNPGVNFYPNLLAFGRLDTSAASLEATSFFLGAAPSAWKELPSYVGGRPSRSGGPSEVVDYNTPTENMPDGLEGPGATNQLLDGPDILAITLAGGGQGVGNDPSTLNLGYLDASTASFYGLPTVCIQMDPNWRTSHTPCVNATPASIAAALAAATKSSDGTLAPAWNPANHAAYPLLDVSYLIAQTHLGPTAAARSVQTLVQYAAAHGASSGVLPPGYADVTSDLTKEALATAGAITLAAPTTPSHPTTPPTTTPTTVPTGPSVGSLSQNTDSFGGGSSLDGAGSTPTTVASIPPPTSTKPTTTSHHVNHSPLHVAFAKAGAQLSGHASWAVLIALTLFSLLGLLFRPVRELRWVARVLAWLRARRVPWRRAPSGAAS